LGKVTKSIEIEASPEKVFAFILDSKKLNETSKGNLEMEPTSKEPVGVGSTSHWVATARALLCTRLVLSSKGYGRACRFLNLYD
jgi:hypothetical protein